MPGERQRSLPASYLLATRKRGTMTEVLLEQRSAEASLMAGMYELPPLPLDVVEGHEPSLRLRHSITNTNYYVQVFAGGGAAGRSLRRAVPTAKADLRWVRTTRLAEVPLTGLARKVLQRLRVMAVRALQKPGPFPG
jgi:A/G-specific adenine glycosylase